MTSSKDTESMWIELSDGNETDWLASFKICQRAFQNDPLYIYTNPDPDIRRKFLAVYYEYLYPAIFKDGRGILALIKTRKADKVKIVGATACSMEEDEDLAKKAFSRFADIDGEGWKRHQKHDEWEMETYVGKMYDLADEFGMKIIYGDYLVIDDECRGGGIGTMFADKGIQLLMEAARRRLQLSGVYKQPMWCGVCDHPTSRNFARKIGLIEVAQLRTNKPCDSKKEILYLWIFLHPSLPARYIEAARRKFRYSANL
ncbi:uncharacterized protein LOC120338306 isoform X1 [Styela clava]